MSVTGPRAGNSGTAVGRLRTRHPPAIASPFSGGTSALAWRAAWFWAAILGACAASGAFYGTLSVYGRGTIGAVYGIACGGAVMLFEQGVVAPGWRARLRELPWLASVIATEIVYVALVVLGAASAGLLLWLPGLMGGSFREAVVIGPTTILYALTVSGIIITMTRMRDLIGADVFRNILLGRYHQPVEEERIFLFIDLIGSTAYAQAHGDLRAQGFLGAIFAALADPVRRHGGSIDDYVGDMALVTWPLKAGVQDGRCIACIFDFLAAIAADAEHWRITFGQVPAFRAALHGGGVVTAEVGVDRHKISYFGDVVNTTGRIEALCRTLDVPVLVSSDLLDQIPALPAGIRGRPLGAHALKGRGQMLAVVGLEPAAQSAGMEAAAA